MEKILAKLGFFPSAEVKKLRTKYILGQVTFALDKVEGLGSFLEIEVRADDNWADKQRKVLDILQQLDPGETIRKSYLELLEDQRSEDNPIS
jgi:adenylate cyclase class 2